MLEAALYKTTWREPREAADHGAAGARPWRSRPHGRSLEWKKPRMLQEVAQAAHQSQERKIPSSCSISLGPLPTEPNGLPEGKEQMFQEPFSVVIQQARKGTFGAEGQYIGNWHTPPLWPPNLLL